jgi:hypothetical protein
LQPNCGIPIQMQCCRRQPQQWADIENAKVIETLISPNSWMLTKETRKHQFWHWRASSSVMAPRSGSTADCSSDSAASNTTLSTAAIASQSTAASHPTKIPFQRRVPASTRCRA